MNITPRFAIEDDDLDLLWRFTAYMELLVSHARIDYLRRQGYRHREIPMTQLAVDKSAGYEDPLPSSPDGFEFDEERLANAFSNLNSLRRQLLVLLFVEGLSAQEAADKLGCSVDYVYLQKHRTLKALRDQLMEEGGFHGE